MKAESERRVTVRPAPDAMAYLSAFLPVKDALACLAALNDAADTAHAANGPERSDAGSTHANGAGANGAISTGAALSRGQVLADTLVERVTGRRRCDGGTNLSVDLLMPLDSLTGGSPAHVPGYGPVPADLVRAWFTRGDPTGPLVRRLFTYPGTGDIIGMDSKARRYPGLLAMLILLRDQVCRTPWCGAPIRHTDHLHPHANGGETSERNGHGLCARCNYIKEHPRPPRDRRRVRDPHEVRWLHRPQPPTRTTRAATTHHIPTGTHPDGHHLDTFHRATRPGPPTQRRLKQTG